MIQLTESTPAKVPIIVYAFHTTDEGGGFGWAPDTGNNRTILRSALIHDLTHRNYETGTLVSLSVAPYTDVEQVTTLLEGEWQDAIEVASVGHVITRFYTTT